MARSALKSCLYECAVMHQRLAPKKHRFQYRIFLFCLDLDEIDTVLAGHYGFTAEELDFILNYDIKYRLGRDTEDEED